MKKLIAVSIAAAFLAAMAPAPASAGGHGWATAGKILTGVVGLHILGHAIANSYAYPAPVYGPPPRAYYPPEQVWVPGHYETRVERQWIPGHWEIESFARHRGYDDDDDDDGDYDRDHRRHDHRVWVPGHYRAVEVRVWIPAHWEERG